MTNVFFVGDELVAGHGDPKALGWTGRVAARTLPLKPELRFHTLAVPGETIGELVARWDEEALRRLATTVPGKMGHEADARVADAGTADPVGVTNAALFAIGRNDLVRNVSFTMTRLNIANALDRAKALGFKTMLVGPPPGREAQNGAIAELAALCEEAAARRAVPYVDLYGPLVRHEQWSTDMASSASGLPLQAGYGLMAWLVLHSAWHTWLGVEDPESV